MKKIIGSRHKPRSLYILDTYVEVPRLVDCSVGVTPFNALFWVMVSFFTIVKEI